jgi:hypothetical protein
LAIDILLRLSWDGIMSRKKPKPIWGLSKGQFVVPDDIDALNPEIGALFYGPWEPEALLTEELDDDTIAAIEASEAGQRSKNANHLMED